MWQRFTEAARKAVFYAQEEAQGLGEGYVSTEHLLLGALREANPATRALERLGIDPVEVARETKKQLPKGGDRAPSDMTLTPRAKRVIDLAYDEVRGLNHDHIGSEHLLLGLLREEQGLAAKVLRKFGANMTSMRATVSSMHDQAAADSPPAPPAEGFVEQIKAKFLRGKRDIYDSDVGLLKGTRHFDVMEAAIREGARKLGIRIIGTHDWLALMLDDETCDAYRMLQFTGADLDSIRDRIRQLRRMPAVEVEPETSPFARLVEQGAVTVAHDLGSRTITTGHVLVSISKFDSGLAGVLLREAGICYEHLYILAGQIASEE